MLTNYFGYKCPNGCMKVGIGVGEPICDHCGTKMIPDKKADSIFMNVTCKKCKSFYGMTNSPNCSCGEPFE